MKGESGFGSAPLLTRTEADMRTISWTEFRTTKIDEIRKRESVIVAGDGEPAFIAIIGAEGDMARTIESHASLIQAGKKLEKW